MKTNRILTTAVVAMSVTAAVGAQSTKAVRQPSKGGTTSMTYTGCVESVNHGATFLLTQIDSGAGAMPSKSFALAGSTDFNKHVGQKVSVTGSLSDASMGTMPKHVSTLTIKTLKVMPKSCS